MIKSSQDTAETFQIVKKITEDTFPIYNVLYKDLGLTHFAYLKYFKDGRYLHFCNNSAWVQARVENNFNLNTTPEAQKKNLLSPSTQISFLAGKPENKMHQLLFDMNIWNGCIIYNIFNEYIEVWGFASTRDDVQKLNFYMNEIDLLKRFTFFYKSKLNSLINTNNPKYFLYDPQLKNFFDSPTQKKDTYFPEFLEHTHINKYIFNDGVSLSKREYECLFLLSKGMPVKAIARSLTLSPRTVEVYIQHLKDKFDFNNKEQLVSFFLKYQGSCPTHGEIQA